MSEATSTDNQHDAYTENAPTGVDGETTQGVATHEPPEPAFDSTDVQYFQEEDRAAGRAIGKMLALFFLYTIVFASIAAYWTYQSVVSR